jgi:hypothetical protein
MMGDDMTMTAPDPERLAALRDCMAVQAMQLEQLIGATWAASTFIGAATGLLIGCMGAAKAAEWLRGVAAELENGNGGRPN